MTSRGTAAAIQTHPLVGDTAHNVEDMMERAALAVAHGAELLVFPELATSGYMLADTAEAARCARALQEERVVERFREFCAGHGAVMVFGYPELAAGGLLYNSALVVDGDGVAGNYRKNHLWNLENEIFTPGDLGHPVFETRLGRIGVLICYDVWFPEAARSLVLAGAEVICLPTNWVPIEGAPHGALAVANVLCQANSHVNGLTIVAADRVGTERGQEFLGKSVITGHTGDIAAGPASATEPQTILARFDGEAGRRERRWNAYNDPVADRRPDTYRTR